MTILACLRCPHVTHDVQNPAAALALHMKMRHGVPSRADFVRRALAISASGRFGGQLPNLSPCDGLPPLSDTWAVPGLPEAGVLR